MQGLLSRSGMMSFSHTTPAVAAARFLYPIASSLSSTPRVADFEISISTRCRQKIAYYVSTPGFSANNIDNTIPTELFIKLRMCTRAIKFVFLNVQIPMSQTKDLQPHLCSNVEDAARGIADAHIDLLQSRNFEG